MAKFISRKAPVSANSLKRRPLGAVVVRHYGRTDLRFTRVVGGWSRQAGDERPEVVDSAAVARECNGAVGCRESWAKVF